jgi:predicted RNA-binding protein
MQTDIHFESIREDWYKANQLMSRLFRNGLNARAQLRFFGFPRQWIPVFEYFGMIWRESRPPAEHMPILSEISEEELVSHCRRARQSGTLRTLVESVVVLDPVLADFLYIVDNTTDYVPSEHKEFPSGPPSTIRLTNWQSYGRPEVKGFLARVDLIPPRSAVAIVLPCARQRPYQSSRTHRRIWRELKSRSIYPDCAHRIVLTSLGVVPEELWDDPVVLQYDAGVPDIYRILRLARRFFSRNSYDEVIDCLQFQPYSDVLEILLREQRICRLSRVPVSRSRQFYLRA